MKKIKKMFAVMLSLAMVLGMAMTVSATEGTPTTPLTPPTPAYPKATDVRPVVVEGLEEGDTANFYKIVMANYKDGAGFTGYEAIEFGTGDNIVKINDVNKPSADDVTAIAKYIVANKIKEEDTKQVATGESGVMSKELPVGMYLVLVTAKDPSVVYNPMIVSVYYTVDGLKTSIVNAGTDFEIDSDKAYAKKSEATLEKTIVNPGSGNPKGDDVAIGDTVKFQIEADIPSYSKEYETIKYAISDTLVGLNEVSNIKVYLDSTKNADGTAAEEVAAEKYTKDVSTDKTSFTLDFDSDYIKGLALPQTSENGARTPHKFIVTYEAKLSESAGVNFDYNTNTAKLTYTNKPESTAKPAEIEKETFHYTFAIDGNLGGKDKYVTGEIIKTDDGDKFVLGNPQESTAKPLEGAKFTLVKATVGEDGKYVKVEGAEPEEAISDEDGRINFSGLDAGHYILQETEAPAGYSVDTTERPVEITAEYYTEGDAAESGAKPGMLKSYSIKIDGKVTSTYTATYEESDENAKLVAVVDRTKEEAAILKNTKLSNLPSTGGIGTTIFTIGGCAIMIIAAGLFFASRRKSSKDAPKEG